MKKIIVTAAIIFFTSTAIFAQTSLWGISWDINSPTNKDYLTKTSYAGGKIEYRHFLKGKNLSYGLALNWASYEQYFPRQTFQKSDGSGAVTSDFVSQAYQVPFAATVHYYFNESKKIRPYVGVALGGQYLEQSLYYNVYVSDDNNWGFLARPEAGVIIRPEGKYWGFVV